MLGFNQPVRVLSIGRCLGWLQRAPTSPASSPDWRSAILDEVQYEPELFAALKPVIDANRNFVRFILTGSTNVLLIPRLSDSLAARMEILRLYPLGLCHAQMIGLGSGLR